MTAQMEAQIDKTVRMVATEIMPALRELQMLQRDFIAAYPGRLDSTIAQLRTQMTIHEDVMREILGGHNAVVPDDRTGHGDDS